MGGLAIGILPDETYEQDVVMLRSGDLIVMVTDDSEDQVRATLIG